MSKGNYALTLKSDASTAYDSAGGNKVSYMPEILEFKCEWSANNYEYPINIPVCI